MWRKIFIFMILVSVVSLNGMAAKTSKQVIAHRGLSGIYPENTMLAFKRALDTKAKYIELDVHLSKDDVPMVIHDRELSRTTTGRGKVDSYPVLALKRFSAGNRTKFGWKFYKEKIPALTDVLDLIDGKDITLLIEIKFHEDGEEAPKDPKEGEPTEAYNKRVGPIVYKTVMKKHSHLKNNIAFISFHTGILEDIRTLDSDVRLGPIFHEMPKSGSLADQALKLDTDIVIFNKELLKLNGIFEHTKKVKHFVYTVKPDEFLYIEDFQPLVGFATDYADLVKLK